MQLTVSSCSKNVAIMLKIKTGWIVHLDFNIFFFFEMCQFECLVQLHECQQFIGNIFFFL